MPRGEKLFGSLARLMLDTFYGRAIICFEGAKLTYVETETRRTWRYKDLPGGNDDKQTGLAGDEHYDVP